MKASVKKNVLNNSTNQNHGRVSPVSQIAMACAVALMAMSASAQQAAPATDAAKQEAAKKEEAAKKAAAKPAAPKVDEIVVTGIRKGIEDAISVKQGSSSIVESISAEDIGKLPDVSIAESIARLPGLAAQRVAGRAQVISVRGLAPDFATTLLNGREQVSTGDNRGVEFDQYPSELLAAVTVYKTPDASLVGQGLSGTLDLQTVRPLNFAKRTVAFNLRGERNSLGKGVDAKDTGNRASVTYIDQSADKKLGIAFGYAHLDSPILANEFGTYGWSADGRPTLPAGTRNTNGIKTFTRSGENKRDGVMGVIEWKATNNWTSVVDVYYSKFKREETNRGLETNLGDYNGGNSPGLRYTSTDIQNGVLIGGTATGIYPLVRGIYNFREDKLTAFGWNNIVRFDGFTLFGDLSYSKAERKELNLETQAQIVDAQRRPVLDTVTFRLNDGVFPTATYGLNYNDPTRLLTGTSIYGGGYGKVPSVKDELKSAKLTATIPWTFKFADAISNVDVGVNFANREKNKRQPEAGLGTANPSLLNSSAVGSSGNLNFAGAGNIVTWNVPNLLARFYDPFRPVDNLSYLIPKAWNVTEKITTGYVKFNLESDLGGISVRGNIGVQIQNTDQSSNSNIFDSSRPAGQQVRPFEDGKKYTDYLPSMNLAFGLPYEQTLRLAIAKQIARPRLDQLKSSLEAGIDVRNPLTGAGIPGASGGNPRLDPWRATALDVSYEKYFGNKGYFALAAFYKDLKTYIFDDKTQDYNFSRVFPAQLLTTPFGTLSQPKNGRGGNLRGYEATISVPFSLIMPELDGFGITASATVTDSGISVGNTNLGSNVALPGLSKNVNNVTAYYEKYGFSARISQRDRSDFIGEITGFGNDRELRYVKGEKILDAQVGYEFRTGMLKGLSMLLQVNNLTNTAYQTYQVTTNQPVEFQKYGRTVLFGLNYKM
jgi:iron complex outermembrane recepter protein